MKIGIRPVPVLIMVLFVTQAALAHPGHGGVGGTAGGLGHPFPGVEYILAMVAVGLWAARSGGRSVWLRAARGAIAACGVALFFHFI